MHNQDNFGATVVADSLNPVGERLTTMVVTFPRIILAEVNTHRMFSRNSASSRAVPFEKMLQRVKDTPFIPLRWMKDHKGMQGAEYFEGLEASEKTQLWLIARNKIIEMAEALSREGITKQIVNRLLEPFLWHTAIISATDWENFVNLRAHEAAEIHMQRTAECMLNALNESNPRQLAHGEWHIPFGDTIDMNKAFREIPSVTDKRIKIATARCARVSYFNFEGKDDYVADVALHDRLAEQGHWSPFEHVAVARDNGCYYGNFRGFVQYRKKFLDENRFDRRVLDKSE